MPNFINLKINLPLPGYTAGQTIKIKTDRNNVPLDLFWRRRLKDALVDNCVEIIKSGPSSSSVEKVVNKKDEK